jgi:hypothetical protein
MPPIIDLAPNRLRAIWTALADFARGTAYQLSLAAFVLMALGFLIMAGMEAGDVETPDWQSVKKTFSISSKPAEEAPPMPQAEILDEPLIAPPLNTPPLNSSVEPPLTEPLAEPLAEPITDSPPLASVSPTPEAEETAPQNLASASEMAALRQTLADTRRQLAEAQAAAENQQPGETGEQLTQLRQRAALADLLLRLDYGWPFDDVLDSGRLDAVLQQRELAVLALHAASGLPTQASIKAQAETLPHIFQGLGETPSALPSPLVWLAERAPKLVAIRQDPMAGARKEMRALYAHLTAKEYNEAAAATRLLILKFQADDNKSDKFAAALQALYADLRSFGETRDVLGALRRDYMAGIRP